MLFGRWTFDGDISHLSRRIANPFQIGNGFDDRHNKAQIFSGRLTFGNNARTRLINRDFHRVDFVIVGNHTARQFFIIFMQGLHG
ncbi:Uncharacterised protein [Vibrio cholerae]|nr:Uncharacterised protein [Vibrio cholerae]